MEKREMRTLVEKVSEAKQHLRDAQHELGEYLLNHVDRSVLEAIADGVVRFNVAIPPGMARHIKDNYSS